MRLIDADALLMHLTDVVLSNTPTGNEQPDNLAIKQAICLGLEHAEQAIKEAPTMTDGARNQLEQKVIDTYLKFCAEGCANKQIRNPTAWALYQTWKAFDILEV